MSDRCPFCGFEIWRADTVEHYDADKHCLGYAHAHAKLICERRELTRLRELVPNLKAQLDRAQLLLIKSRDAIDLAIGELQQRPESEVENG